ncbi:hypothetical protein CN138_34045 [Sinorhizobium meliloti]|nr:hypothetical protein C3L21_22155 [Sinorhizobium meliloti]QGJ79253.1 hypothetical protein C3L21_36420 [Sinorhizobium meliloti]RVE78387.1 hypothetical protein CN235_35075 [Sinorhizobium meliloti]RVE80900.1 hypothetical protein CN238_30580 [Sinorhizobium meliloti]RVG61837.1 hypothetical protein CN220_30060 [Sinorhizobium meliloti]
MRRRNRRVCLRRVQAVLLESPKDVGDSRRMSVQKFEPAKVVDIPTVKRIEELTPLSFSFRPTPTAGAVEGRAFTQ